MNLVKLECIKYYLFFNEKIKYKIMTRRCSIDAGVRDAAAETMGISLKHLGEKNLAPFLADLDQLKLAKVPNA